MRVYNSAANLPVGRQRRKDAKFLRFELCVLAVKQITMKRLLFFCLFFFILSSLSAQKKASPQRVIFDTDMGPDYDDAGAIALLYAFADSRKINILATMASTKYEGVAAVLNVFNTYFNRPNLPIGVPKGDAVQQKDWQHWTDTLIVNYPHAIKKNSDAEDAVALYRKILAKQPDNSVVIITVGFLTNISNLLQSKPDIYSSLNGIDLVKKKVKKLVSMAGRFPEGKEFNVFKDIKASQYAFAHFPKPVYYCGFEIGERIKCGLPLVHNEAIQNDPVKDVFRISIPQAAEDSAGRKSWDEVTTLLAITGFQPYYDLKEGNITVAEDGSNTWNGKRKNQFYLIDKNAALLMQTTIDKLMMHQPVK